MRYTVEEELFLPIVKPLNIQGVCKQMVRLIELALDRICGNIPFRFVVNSIRFRYHT